MGGSAELQNFQRATALLVFERIAKNNNIVSDKFLNGTRPAGPRVRR